MKKTIYTCLITTFICTSVFSQQALKDEGRFAMTNLNINSPEEDFGATYINDKIAFTTSNTSDGGLIKRTWSVNGFPFLDVYQASVDKEGQLSEPKKFTKKVDKHLHDGPVTFSEDGQYMIFTRNNYDSKSEEGIRKLELYSAEMKEGKWVNEKPLPFNNKEYSVGQPALSPDGKVLYFVSDMRGGFGATDLYKSTRQADGTWSLPVNMGKDINTEGEEMFPFYHSKGILFFSSTGHGSSGGLDIFLTEITSNGIGKVSNAGAPANSQYDDFSFVLNKEMTSGYLASNRPGGKGSDDMYYFKLLKPFIFGKTVKGFSKDKNGKVLPFSKVTFMDESKKSISTVTTGEDGAFQFTAEPDKKYVLNGSKEKYFDGESPVNTATNSETVNVDVILEKDPGVSLLGLVKEKGSNNLLEGVTVKMLDNITGKELGTLTTGKPGDYRAPLYDKKLNERMSYNISFEKPGYLSKTVTFNAPVDKEGVITIPETYLDKIEVGVDLAKLVDLKPIYFDLAKWNIRKDASLELDKIVKVMNENPGMIVELGSHTDCRGTAKANEMLSDKRAKSSAEYIKSKITNPDRISGKGYGESKLINGCACEGTVKSKCSETEHQQNRRTEFIIVKLK